MDANRDALKVFQMVRSQTLDRLIMTGMGGGYTQPRDLNHVAVWMAIDALKVRDRLDCFNRVIAVWHKWFEDQEWN